MSVLRTLLGVPFRIGCDHDGCDVAYGLTRFIREWRDAGWGIENRGGHWYHYCEAHALEHGCHQQQQQKTPL